MTDRDDWSLQDWLQWQESLHGRPIELGLGRVREVAGRMPLALGSAPVITVAGTNGKGSTLRMLESIYRAAGYSVGAYSSPHLLRYNERVRLNGTEVGDADLCAAFRAIEAARQDVSLTYFEFGTLAAFHLFSQAQVDVWLLEVGLGGRLDAVNLIDADVAVITSIGLDHMDWLGPDRESIGREKAGIMRGERPVVCGDRQPPDSLIGHAAEIGARLSRLGVDFEVEQCGPGFDWRHRDGTRLNLPLPGIPGAVQLDNAAGVVAAVQLLNQRLPVEPTALARGLSGAAIAGRLQVVPGTPEIWLDVGHNPDAIAVLARHLAEVPARGRTLAVIGMLGDKSVTESVGSLRGLVDEWYPASLQGPRTLPVGAMHERLAAAEVSGLHPERPVADAFRQAVSQAGAADRLLVFGSFLTVSAVLAILPSQAVPVAAAGG